MGNVRLYGATSGYTELAPPAVAPDGVLSLPSGTGTLLTAEGGKVLQVVRATDTTLRSTTSTSFVDVTGMSVTITPQKSTSAILVMAYHLDEITGASGYIATQITNSANTQISGGGVTFTGPNAQDVASVAHVGYDTPATTSAVTYKLRFKVTAGTGSVLNNEMPGQMYAIEVSA